MIKKILAQIPEFLAGDKTILKEVFHPKNDEVDINYSLAKAYIKKGEQSLPHHLAQSELYLFLKGEGKIFINKESTTVQKGTVIYVPPKATQYVVNTGQESLEFLCIVYPPWTAEGEEIT